MARLRPQVQGSGTLSDSLRRFTRVERGEERLVLASAGTFFFLLFGYFLMRPLRGMYGIRGGFENLPLLAIGVVGVVLLLNPVFGFAVSRIPVRRFVPAFYRVVILGALVFFGLAVATPWGSATAFGYAFYVWLSVFNLFMTSVFWQLMADAWKPEQAKRLYGLVGVGGTLGAVLSSLFVTRISDIAAWLDMPGDDLIPWFLLGAAACLEIAVRLSAGLRLRGDAAAGGDAGAPQRLGGGGFDGLRDVVRNPYLRRICGYVFLFTFTSTLFWFLWNLIVAETAKDDATRVTLFAWKNVADQGFTLLVQLFFTSRIMQWIGVGRTMALLPLVWMFGSLAVALLPVFATIWVVQVLRRGVNLSLAKPSRESLFSVVTREEKYKAKAVLDTFVYRTGDVCGAAVVFLLPKSLAMVWPIAAIMLPLSLAGAWLGIRLGKERRARAEDVP